MPEVKFHKVGKGVEPDVEEITWQGLKKPTLFYFAGAGQIERSDVEPNVARFIKSLARPEYIDEEKFDIVIIRIPDLPYTANASRKLPPNFFDMVLSPIIEQALNADDSIAFLKKEFSKITFFGYSRGAKIIESIFGTFEKQLRQIGLNDSGISTVMNSLLGVSIGSEQVMNSQNCFAPHLIFTHDKDNASSYYQPSRINPRCLPTERLDNEAFVRHKAMSHKREGNKLMVVSHGVTNSVRTAEVYTGEDKLLHKNETRYHYKDNVRFTDAVSTDGHHPYLYINSSGELPYRGMVMFQTNPSAHIIKAALRSAIQTSLYAEKGIIRNGGEIVDRVCDKYLSEEAKDNALRLLELTEQGRKSSIR